MIIPSLSLGDVLTGRSFSATVLEKPKYDFALISIPRFLFFFLLCNEFKGTFFVLNEAGYLVERLFVTNKM